MKRRSTAFLAALAAAAVTLTACSTADPEVEQNLTLTLAPIGDVQTFAPQQAGDGHAVQWSQPVYDTLVRQLPDGTFTGMLATEWSYDETLTELTLELTSEATFSDGTPFDATAVKVNLEATRDGTGPLSTQLASIADIVVVDSDTVVLKLSAPDPSLIRGLSQPSGMIANPAVVGDESLATTPDGTGPYVLDADRTVPGSEYVFVRKDDYWNTDLDLPYSELIYRPMTDITARVNALQAGEVDGAYIDNKTMDQLSAAGATVVTYPAAGVVGIFILDRAGDIVPALADVRVRQAINLVLDREGMLRQLRSGLGTPTQQIFNPQTAVFDESLDATYDLNVERARELLVEAGYADGFTMQVPEVAFFTEGPIVAQALADIGITIEWAPVPANEVINEMRTGKYPLIIMQLQSTDPWQAIQFFVSPRAPWNILGSEDAELTALIAAAQNASGDEQLDAYAAVNRYLVDEAWFAPFYFPDNIYAVAAGTTVEPQYQQGVPSIYNYSPTP